MKATELRIGNIVWQGEQYKESIVTSYELNQFSNYNRGVTHLAEYYKEWKPIPLTEEWLVKFGFKYIGSAPTLGINESWNRGNIRIEQLQSKELVFHGLQIKYVHSLQNLYFALTGKELLAK